ncbi:MAG TPA: response regulator [Acinetobacter ursingii]|uniref:Response regulator n=1 Tax=Acinetobacter ursingii TaxID=108980 RepID=A0A3D2SQ11_9GAMM|nr:MULTISPECIES: ANTAR domain-containing protein [Acinetobacter]MCH2005107.1 ANTAR domain-containing protein [Acinetobacter ursingii]MCU4304566.1 ANTAR domain-containing protein [Acinetobacter ursingii]MCU4352951.1 ANTAR domain-containing protein [Acinetobacter ursingii]MCU4370571.1 ANTAR domain-containing protein [Acinetobacter ursingii]MCU4380180.1 ANTAR domain-containing protein [Acinetobacter ursingii]
MSKLKIALIDDDFERAEFVQQNLRAHDFDVVACLTLEHINDFQLEQLQADVILLDMDHPHRDLIESCVSHFDLPTVLFTKNTHKDTIKQAIAAGVTAYIVDGIDPARLDTILEISIEQYKKHKQLESDLKETKLKLADRKDIEKAKVLLMQLHHLAEDTAFQLLRKNAMSHRITMGDMARRLIDAQQLLHHPLKED